MPSLETPEEFVCRVGLHDRGVHGMMFDEEVAAVTARDAAIRAESSALLKTCGEALTSAKGWNETAQETLNPDRDIPCDDQAWVQIGRANEKIGAALAAIREAGVSE